MYIEMGSTIKVLENQIAALKKENADLVTKEKNSDLWLLRPEFPFGKWSVK